MKSLLDEEKRSVRREAAARALAEAELESVSKSAEAFQSELTHTVQLLSMSQQSLSGKQGVEGELEDLRRRLKKKKTSLREAKRKIKSLAGVPENLEKTQQALQDMTAERDRLNESVKAASESMEKYLATQKSQEENAKKSKETMQHLQFQIQSLNATCDKLNKDIDDVKIHYKQEMALRYEMPKICY
jgi:chromosome segregation ATPase